MKKFFLLAAAALMAFAACEKNPDDNGGIIDDNGGNGGGTQTEVAASLKGSAYVPFILDEETAKTLGSKIVLDMRPDDTNKFLYVWDNTYAGAEAAGLNFYGNLGYTSLAVTNGGWSGAGFNAKPAADPGKKFSGKGWTFHVAYKGPANVAQFLTVICDLTVISPEQSTETLAGKLCLGQGSYDEYNSNGQFVKTHTAINPVSGSFVPNEWNEYEIDFTTADFFPNGIPEGGSNIVTFSSGGVAGTPIMLDALFLYKK